MEFGREWKSSIKIFLAVFFVIAMMSLSACNQQQAPAQRPATSASPGNTPTPDPAPQISVPPPQPATDAQGRQPSSPPSGTGEVKEFRVEMYSWEFNPSTITVKKGDTVKLTAVNTEGTHGISIQGYSAKTRSLSPGQEETIEFVADKQGTFGFYCNVYCGEGHQGMTGTLIVE